LQLRHTPKPHPGNAHFPRNTEPNCARRASILRQQN
jgi:hypothetical protein